MITVTLTNTRHIAAATAAYITTIPSAPEDGQEPTPAPFTDVTAYVQAAIERVAESWADSLGVDAIPVGAFVRRFSAAEFGAIQSSADPAIQGLLASLDEQTKIRLGSPGLARGVAYLVSVGMLTQERADQILAF